MAKLTLSVDPVVIERAKRYAEIRGTSVSQLVEQMLDVMSATAGADHDAPPVLARLRGAIKTGNLRDYQRYLERKYR